MSAHGGTDHLTLTVPRNPAATQVVLVVEFSDLSSGDWSAADGVVVADSPTQLVIRDSVTVTDAPRRFARIRAFLQP